MIDNDERVAAATAALKFKNQRHVRHTLIVGCVKTRVRSGQCPTVLEVEGSTPASARATRARATRTSARFGERL